MKNIEKESLKEKNVHSTIESRYSNKKRFSIRKIMHSMSQLKKFTIFSKKKKKSIASKSIVRLDPKKYFPGSLKILRKSLLETTRHSETSTRPKRNNGKAHCQLSIQANTNARLSHRSVADR